MPGASGEALARVAAWVAAALFVLAAPLASAQTGAGSSEPPLRVTLNHASAITYQGSGATALIADPAVADIVTERGNVVFVLGRSIGTTNLLVYDATGRRLVEREIEVVPDEAGVVTVTRDIYENDYFCTPRCVSPPPPASVAGSVSSAPGGSSGPSPFNPPGGPAVAAPAAPATAGVP
jgi:hypothetical protein